MSVDLLTDAAVLRDIGQRLSRIRIDANRTQAALAREAGVSRSTVERLESGHSVQLANFIRILRVARLLDPVLRAIPEPGLSPVALLRAESRSRKRARRSEDDERQRDPAWRWADEQ